MIYPPPYGEGSGYPEDLDYVGDPVAACPQPLNIQKAALKRIVETNRRLLGLPPQADEDATEDAT